MLLILFACCLAAANALTIVYPYQGQRVPIYSALKVSFDTDGDTFDTLSVSFGGVEICSLNNVTGLNSCTGTPNSTNVGNTPILVTGRTIRGLRVSQLVTVQVIYSSTDAPTLMGSVDAITIDYLWAPSNNYDALLYNQMPVNVPYLLNQCPYLKGRCEMKERCKCKRF